ncbi:UDP-3-O-acyl-N-acetylglucosamine deacetylase [Vibrio crassostreae]|uniref:UDP-3-O-acyl-N-acetylglucosamine deacetylase n=1 Tax=Vibrio crassostreae TaxID=246167 RepID=UPI001B3066C2|nr:UDP-3-O-acyl-N-acetylglucosamine deacetylase [Vibrio crassostreae]
MTIRKQKTILKPFIFSGVGLHSGQQCTVKVHPADVDHGVRFIATEDPFKTEVLVSHESLDGGTLGTNLLVDVYSIKTVEHFLAALCALEIDNLVVEVSGGEMPIQDGSSIEYLMLFEKAGIVSQDAGKTLNRLEREVSVAVDGKHFYITPRSDDKVVFDIKIDFDNNCVKKMPQSIIYTHTKENFMKHLASARTFGFKRDLDYLLEKGLCLGGSLHNAILFNEQDILNPEGLRFSNEIIAHKTLDIIGDLFPLINSTCGFTIEAFKPGHTLNSKALNEVMGKTKKQRVNTVRSSEAEMKVLEKE